MIPRGSTCTKHFLLYLVKLISLQTVQYNWTIDGPQLPYSCSIFLSLFCSPTPSHSTKRQIAEELERLLLDQRSKFTLFVHGHQNVATPNQFTIHKDLWECRPVTILLQCLPQSIIMLFIEHINTFIIHPLAFKDANYPLWESTHWCTSWTFDKCHHLVLFDQLVNKFLQWDCQLDMTARCQPKIRLLLWWLPDPGNVSCFVTWWDLSRGLYVFLHPWFPSLGKSCSIRLIYYPNLQFTIVTNRQILIHYSLNYCAQI